MTVIHLKKKDVVKSSVKGISIEFDHEQCVAILDVHWKKLEFVNTSRRYGKSRGTQNPLRSPRRFANDATIMKAGRVRSVEMKPSRKVHSFYGSGENRRRDDDEATQEEEAEGDDEGNKDDFGGRR
ncbi:hypothetical protein Dimus_010741 [Dionaea muscipula]